MFDHNSSHLVYHGNLHLEIFARDEDDSPMTFLAHDPGTDRLLHADCE